MNFQTFIFENKSNAAKAVYNELSADCAAENYKYVH